MRAGVPVARGGILARLSERRAGPCRGGRGRSLGGGYNSGAGATGPRPVVVLSPLPWTAPLAANPHRNPGARADPSAPPDPDDDLYRLLGVMPAASAAEITRAYRAAMKRTHPDRQPAGRRVAAEEHAKRLNLAYATLSKPLARQGYDRTLRARVVQDELMGRYVGGFYVPQADGSGADPVGRPPRRPPTAAERRERELADRNALTSIVLVFGGLTLAVVALLLLWSVLGAVVGAVF